jgi:hypothetical protein
MRATARKALVLIPLLVWAADTPAQQVLDLFTGLAASLASGDSAAFLSNFDKKMPGYEKLREHITALTKQADVTSYVDFATNEGDGQKREVDIIWKMQIHRGQDATSEPAREQTLHCIVEKQGRSWKITSLTPIDFFAPQQGAEKLFQAADKRR